MAGGQIRGAANVFEPGPCQCPHRAAEQRRRRAPRPRQNPTQAKVSPSSFRTGVRHELWREQNPKSWLPTHAPASRHNPKTSSMWPGWSPPTTPSNLTGNRDQQVAFGTSGHRGSSLDDAFNEPHVLAIAEAIVGIEKRRASPARSFSGSTPMRCPNPRGPRHWRCWLPMTWW